MRIVTTYDVVSYPATKTLRCPICGNRVRRQRTFRQTLNPFNRTANGTLKTRGQILRELGSEAAAWAKIPEPHRMCAAPPRA